MAYEQVWVLIASVFVLGVVALRLIATLAEQRLAQRRRELVHKERMEALARGIVFHDMPFDLVEDLPRFEPLFRRDADLARYSSLGLGLVMAAAGLGWLVAFPLIADSPEMVGMRELAPLGAIPLLVGIGLLLFARLLGQNEDGDGTRA